MLVFKEAAIQPVRMFPEAAVADIFHSQLLNFCLAGNIFLFFNSLAQNKRATVGVKDNNLEINNLSEIKAHLCLLVSEFGDQETKMP
jgi:hypothetical protein